MRTPAQRRKRRLYVQERYRKRDGARRWPSALIRQIRQQLASKR